MRNQKIKNLAFMSLFVAIEVVMVMIPFLGFIPIGPLRATTLHIPVIIAGIVLGKKQGAILGFVFGLLSLVTNTISPTVTSFVFSPFISHSLWSLVIVLLPRICIGYIAGFIYEKLKKYKIIAMISSAFISSLVHTVLVLFGIYLLFGPQYANVIGQDFQTLLPYLIGIITTNGLLEAIIGTIISVCVSKSLLRLS